MWCIKLALLCVLCVVVLGQSKASTNPLKSLWNSLSSPQKKELAKIMGNSSLTKGEMMKRLNKMVDRIKNKKAKMARDDMIRKLEEYRKNQDAITANMSAEAKAVMKQIIAMDLDDSRTFKNDCLDGNRLIDTMSDAVKTEIPYLQKQDCGKSVLDRYLQKQ